jgi:DDE superfamily endonuclease
MACVNSTGFFNARTFSVTMEAFKAYMTLVNPGREAVVLLDNLGVHGSIQLQLELQRGDNKVHLLFLPPNTTHFMQPNDDLFFRNLRCCINKNLCELKAHHAIVGEDVKETLFRITMTAEDKIAHSGVIEKSWANTGQHPFSPDLIRSNLKKKPPQWFCSRIW